jgi:hypothetical protein
MTKASCSPTGLPSAGFEMEKLRQSMAMTDLISTNARLRPGQNRGPEPKGIIALGLCPG